MQKPHTRRIPSIAIRVLGSAALGLALSAQSSISINGSFERMLFDNTEVNTDFNRSSVYVHYEVQGARTDLTANLGATKVDQGAESFTGTRREAAAIAQALVGIQAHIHGRTRYNRREHRLRQSAERRDWRHRYGAGCRSR